ncbi:hypothetical protein DFJ73DRAFT_794119 [Zopfochytrium polystomum]|nr:hypothetical protein DFJ73DRAFT_794119 [Zopfochytrium polystomum]
MMTTVPLAATRDGGGGHGGMDSAAAATAMAARQAAIVSRLARHEEDEDEDEDEMPPTQPQLAKLSLSSSSLPHSLRRRRRRGRFFFDAHYQHVEPALQTGPTCGLLALCIARCHLLSPPPPPPPPLPSPQPVVTLAPTTAITTTITSSTADRTTKHPPPPPPPPPPPRPPPPPAPLAAPPPPPPTPPKHHPSSPPSYSSSSPSTSTCTRHLPALLSAARALGATAHGEVFRAADLAAVARRACGLRADVVRWRMHDDDDGGGGGGGGGQGAKAGSKAHRVVVRHLRAGGLCAVAYDRDPADTASTAASPSATAARVRFTVIPPRVRAARDLDPDGPEDKKDDDAYDDNGEGEEDDDDDDDDGSDLLFLCVHGKSLHQAVWRADALRESSLGLDEVAPDGGRLGEALAGWLVLLS